jgi:hypothetical protein
MNLDLPACSQHVNRFGQIDAVDLSDALDRPAFKAAKDHGARDKARVAYQDFLTLWKDADSDLPILIQAKTEYARLR